MEREIVIGNGRVRFFNSDGGNLLQENQGEVLLTNIRRKFHLFLGIGIPCDYIQWYSCVNNTVTVELRDGCIAKTMILNLETIEQVKMIISKVKPPKKPRA
jgi:hypothetical protein